MNVLGIHIFGHDTGAAVIKPSFCVSISEERLSRIKHDTAPPEQAIRYCLDAASLKLNEVDLIVYSGNFGRFPQARIEDFFRKSFGWYESKKFLTADHHVLHAWGAAAMAQMTDAAILVIDGNGSLVQQYRDLPKVMNCHPSHFSISETIKASMFRFSSGELRRIKYLTCPPGIGALYSTFTQYLGFGKLDAGKTMGLAAYSRGGQHQLPQKIYERSLDESGDLNFLYHPQTHDLEILSILLGREPRTTKTLLPEPFYNEVAGLIQKECEAWLLDALEHLAGITRAPNVILSGGVALNCKANQVIENSSLFEDYFFFPAASDTGIPLGACLLGWQHLGGDYRKVEINSMYMGRSYKPSEIRTAYKDLEGQVEVIESNDLPAMVARELSNGRIVGLFQGRAELGPRALGNRSILADPRQAEHRDILNDRVKKRESWRPFAPAVLAEDYSLYFEGSPRTKGFMNVSDTVRADMRNIIPAVTHVDGTARPQVVTRESNTLLYEIISKFKDITGVGCILNTSFNIAGFPIVETPPDAIECLFQTELDAVAFPTALIRKVKLSIVS
jgi:carbamoyltransferase